MVSFYHKSTRMFSLGLRRVGSSLRYANMAKSASSVRLFASVTSSELRDSVLKLYDVCKAKAKAIIP